MVEVPRVTEDQDFAVAWMSARRGVDAEAIGAALGLAMPPPRASRDDGATVILSVAPGTWLVRHDEAPSGWFGAMERRLAGLASLSDQSGAYRLFHVEGRGARERLQRGIAIDLHDLAFPSGSVATSAIAHIDVVLRCLSPGDAYEIAVYRSYAESFLRWLDATGFKG